MIILLLIFLFLFTLVMRVVKFNIISPLYIYLMFYIIALGLSVPYYYYFDDKVSLYNFDFISSAQFDLAVTYHLIAMIAFCVGVLVFYDFSSSKSRLLLNKSFAKSLFLNPNVQINILPAIHVIMFTIILFCGITYGKEIFYRNIYLVEENRTFITLFKLLSFVATLMLALVFRKHKWIALFYFTLVMLIGIGTGSRLAFVYLAVFALLIYQTSSNKAKDKLILVLNMVIALIFLSYLMTLRMLPEHGIVPYLSSVFSNSKAVGDSLVFNIYYSFIFGVFVSAKTLMENVPNWNNILVAVNPATGNMAGWYDIAKSMRLNRFAPMSANGEVFTMGKTFTFIFFTFIGAIFTYFEVQMRIFFNKKKRVIGFIIALLSILFVAMSFEYNLRSTMRYIYYITFVIIVAGYLSKFKYKIGSVKIPKLQKTDL
ncbi:MAG: hypothetical protein ACSHWW_00360 [Nonlabens sp.]|uniref:hypothetical protein n=1 Tax=Nonlabens sp. TaxID=1888209 RepID=UPI003EF0F874